MIDEIDTSVPSLDRWELHQMFYHLSIRERDLARMQVRRLSTELAESRKQCNELWKIAIGEDDHDPRCSGDCGPCGGIGHVPDNIAMSCLTCGGDGKCKGCSTGYLLKFERNLRALADS